MATTETKVRASQRVSRATNKEKADVLTLALEIIAARGWGQYRPFEPPRGAVDADAAIRLAARQLGDSAADRSRLEFHAAEAVMGEGSLAHYNNHPTTTEAHVVRQFRNAIAKCLRYHNGHLAHLHRKGTP